MIPPPAGPRGAAPRHSYVYLLKSRTTGQFYVGWTTDLLRRVAGHVQGVTSYSRTRGPWQLIGWEQVSSQAKAKARERMLKRNPHMLALFKKRLVNVARTRTGSRQVVG